MLGVESESSPCEPSSNMFKIVLKKSLQLPYRTLPEPVGLARKQYRRLCLSMPYKIASASTV